MIVESGCIWLYNVLPLRPQILLGQIFNSLDSECNEEHVEEFFLGKAKRKRIGFCNQDKLSNEDM